MWNILILKTRLHKSYTLLLSIVDLRNQNTALFICMEWGLISYKVACLLIFYLKMWLFAVLISVEAEKAKESVALLESNSIAISVFISQCRIYNNSFEERRLSEVYTMGKVYGSFCQLSLFFYSFLSQFLCSPDFGLSFQ